MFEVKIATGSNKNNYRFVTSPLYRKDGPFEFGIMLELNKNKIYNMK